MALKRGHVGARRTSPKTEAEEKTPPIITSEYGVTTESARRHAAENIRTMPDVRARVEEHFTKKLGSRERGMAEMRRCYPEAFDEGVPS